MTTPLHGHYDLTMDEVEKIGKAIGPTIREGIRLDVRLDLAAQTGEIGEIIGNHEKHDNLKFDELEKGQKSIESRVGSLELRLAKMIGMAVAAIAILEFVFQFAGQIYGHAKK